MTMPVTNKTFQILQYKLQKLAEKRAEEGRKKLEKQSLETDNNYDLDEEGFIKF